jgi:hypothetical protein
MPERHLSQPVASERSERRIGFPEVFPLRPERATYYKLLLYSYAAPVGRMVYNHVNPMRRSLRSLATGWDKCLSGIGFQPA